ncbi:MAG TPA: ATP-binding cassette domain-containing protein [Chlamydiales bacterium]|nr:ATP-binding cassette domain-containing protein [Chlamydiales bacterium]
MTRPQLQVALRAEKLQFSYGNIPILQGAGFEIFQGEFIGIIGPNGGGKTTLLKLIMGFLTPQGGKLSVFGQSPLLVRQRIGYVPQANLSDRNFPITVLELVMLGCLSRHFSYPAKTKEKALLLIDELGLGAHQSKAFSSLSGGLAQKALLARSLLSDPDLLLLDEPIANIDPLSRMAISKKLASFKGKKTILLVTHDLGTIVKQVDRLLCIQSQIISYQPEEVCGHFALGLYHIPLLRGDIERVSL